jgi:cell division protein FtsN
VPAIQPGTLYLQVLASRDAEPSRKALLEIKSKGHPVTLDNHDPGWFRILVGPFDTREAANAYQLRLESEGIKSFLRKF